MSLLTRSMASLAILPALLPFLVRAMPAVDPLVTPLARLEERANGANIIGYSSSGTTWRTRSCNNGFFSTSGSIGNCCVNASCDFITSCAGSSVFYATATAGNCGNVCGTGTIYHTRGDLKPVYMFNCDSDWIVTMTVGTATSTTSTGSQPQTVTATSTLTPNPSTVVTTRVGVVATTAAATAISSAAASASASARQVTLTITDSAGSTSVQILSASSSASSTSLSLHNKTSTSKTGLIAGVAVGVVVALALIAIAIILLLRHRSKKNKAAALISAQPDYMAPNVGGAPQGPPPPFGQVPPMGGAYQQNQYYGKDGQAAWGAPVGGMQQEQMGYKPQDQYANSREMQNTVPPVYPIYPTAHEMAGSPVGGPAPVELSAHPK